MGLASWYRRPVFTLKMWASLSVTLALNSRKGL